MISLGGIELSNSMVWQERYTGRSVQATERRFLGGGLHITAAKLTGGKPITLAAGEEFGWLTRDQVEQVMALASDPVGVYTLLFNGASYEVAFRHSEAPAVEMFPLIARTNDESGDYFAGQIKLITL